MVPLLLNFVGCGEDPENSNYLGGNTCVLSYTVGQRILYELNGSDQLIVFHFPGAPEEGGEVYYRLTEGKDIYGTWASDPASNPSLSETEQKRTSWAKLELGEDSISETFPCGSTEIVITAKAKVGPSAVTIAENVQVTVEELL